MRCPRQDHSAVYLSLNGYENMKNIKLEIN